MEDNTLDVNSPNPAESLPPAQANPAGPAAAQAAPAAPTFGQSIVNPPASPAAKPPDQHDYFRSILGVLSGGSRKPVTDSSGKPVVGADGKVATVPMTKANLGAGILAGALASMMAGFNHLPERNGNGVMQTHLNEAGAAGAEAGAQNSAQARVQKAQQMSDEDRLRQYQTMKQNLDLHSMSLSVDRMDDEAKTATIAKYAPLYQGLQNVEFQGKPIIAGENESESELQKRIKESGGDVTRDSAIPSGSRPEIGKDGKPTGRTEMLWTSFHNGGQIPITPEMQKEYGLDPSTVGQKVPVSALVQKGLNASNSALAGRTMDGVTEKMNEFNKSNKKPEVKLDWNELKKKNPSFKAYEQQLNGLAGLDPDQFVVAASKISPNLGAAIQDQLKVDFDAWANKRVGDKKAAENDAARQLKKDEAEDAAATPKGKADLAHTLAQTKKLQEDAKNLEQKDVDKDEIAAQLVKPDNLTAMRDIGGRGADRYEILAKAARLARSQGVPFDMGLVNRRVDFLKEYEDPKGKAAINRGALNNLLQHAGDLQDANDANKRLDLKFLNTPVNKLKDQIGNDAYVRYQTVNNVLKDELALYFAGGYAPNKEQQGTWDRIQSDTATPDATMSFAKEIARLAMRRADTHNEAFKTMMGYNDPNLITPAAKAAGQHLDTELAKLLDKYGSGGKLGGGPNKPKQLTPAGRNPATGQQIGWDADAKQYVDIVTGQPLQQ